MELVGLVESRRPFDVDDGKVRGGGSGETALANLEAGDAHACLPAEIASGIESPLGARDLRVRADASRNDGGRKEIDQPNYGRFLNRRCGRKGRAMRNSAHADACFRTMRWMLSHESAGPWSSGQSLYGAADSVEEVLVQLAGSAPFEIRGADDVESGFEEAFGCDSDSRPHLDLNEIGSLV